MMLLVAGRREPGASDCPSRAGRPSHLSGWDPRVQRYRPGLSGPSMGSRTRLRRRPIAVTSQPRQDYSPAPVRRRPRAAAHPPPAPASPPGSRRPSDPRCHPHGASGRALRRRLARTGCGSPLLCPDRSARVPWFSLIPSGVPSGRMIEGTGCPGIPTSRARWRLGITRGGDLSRLDTGATPERSRSRAREQEHWDAGCKSAAQDPTLTDSGGERCGGCR